MTHRLPKREVEEHLHGYFAQKLGISFLPQTLKNRIHNFMSLSQTISDDLATLDADATATATAVTAKATTAQALASAAAADNAAAADVTKASDAQATQLAKTIADIQAQYGQPTPAPVPTP